MEKYFDIIGNDNEKLYIQKDIGFDTSDIGRKIVLYSFLEDITKILNHYTDKNVNVIAYAYIAGEP